MLLDNHNIFPQAIAYPSSFLSALPTKSLIVLIKKSLSAQRSRTRSSKKKFITKCKCKREKQKSPYGYKSIQLDSQNRYDKFTNNPKVITNQLFSIDTKVNI